MELLITFGVMAILLAILGKDLKDFTKTQRDENHDGRRIWRTGDEHDTTGTAD